MSEENKTDGGSAFPQHGWSRDPRVQEEMKHQGGMSLFVYFAAQAMKGIMSNPNHCDSTKNYFDGARSVAHHAFIVARAMMTEYEKGKPE